MRDSDDDIIYKRYKRVILVGTVTDRLVSNLREIERRKRILSAFASAQEVGGKIGAETTREKIAPAPGTPVTGITAPEIRGNPRRTTEGEPARGSGFSGKLNR